MIALMWRLACLITGFACLLGTGMVPQHGPQPRAGVLGPFARAGTSALWQSARASGRTQVLVTLRLPGTTRSWSTMQAALRQERASLLAQVGAAHMRQYGGQNWIFPIMALAVDAKGLARLERSPLVDTVEPDRQFILADTATNATIGAPVAWAQGYAGDGQGIVIVDTGVQANHPYFGNRVIAEACFSGDGQRGQSLCPNGDMTQFGPGSAAPCTVMPTCAHGTAVAGIAAGDGSYSGGPGYSGVAPHAKLIAVQVTSNLGAAGSIKASGSDILAALNWVYQTSSLMPIAAVNLSLGFGDFHAGCDAAYPALALAVDALLNIGIPVVTAAGNEGLSDGIGFPACLPYVIGVGAVDSTDQIASFSNRWPNNMLLAPGVEISTSLPSDYGLLSGTSAASPVVAGALAVLRSASPHASVDQLLTALRATGHQVRDAVSGNSYARVQLDAAVTSLLALPPPSATPPPTATPTASATDSATASLTPTSPSATPSSSPTGTPRPSRTPVTHAKPLARPGSPSVTAVRAAGLIPRLSGPESISKDGYLTVWVQTTPRASVQVSVQIQDTQPARSTGSGTTRPQPSAVVLYKTGLTARADRSGSLRARIRVAYMPVHARTVLVIIQARVGHATARQTFLITLHPRAR